MTEEYDKASDIVLDIDDEDEEENQIYHDEIRGLFSENVQYVENVQSNEPDFAVAGPSGMQTLYSKETKFPKSEARSTPRHSQMPSSRGNTKLKQSESAQGNVRLCEHHTFLTDITEVRQMEQGLLRLLDDFHSGKLKAFGRDCTFEKMEQVREQQERLARLHFELNAQQELYGPQSEEARSVGRENLGKLIENLQQLSQSIEQLQISSSSIQTDV